MSSPPEVPPIEQKIGIRNTLNPVNYQHHSPTFKSTIHSSTKAKLQGKINIYFFNRLTFFSSAAAEGAPPPPGSHAVN